MAAFICIDKKVIHIIGHIFSCCRAQSSSLSHTAKRSNKGKSRIVIKLRRFALFFDRILQKSTKTGGYLINFLFLLKKNREKVWCYKKMQYLCNKFLEKLNDRLIVNLFFFVFLRKKRLRKRNAGFVKILHFLFLCCFILILCSYIVYLFYSSIFYF